mmetsp:Transcript_3918/g.4522  ORF Transcript_3918/g.4522 Transcript_3918/m.4522 type:complete len:106 (+) Transcript_3918:71-388(+)
MLIESCGTKVRANPKQEHSAMISKSETNVGVSSPPITRKNDIATQGNTKTIMNGGIISYNSASHILAAITAFPKLNDFNILDDPLLCSAFRAGKKYRQRSNTPQH